MRRDMTGLAGAPASGVNGVADLWSCAGVAVQTVALMDIDNDAGAHMTDHTLGGCLNFAVLGAGVPVISSVAGFAGSQGARIDSAGGYGRDLCGIGA